MLIKIPVLKMNEAGGEGANSGSGGGSAGGASGAGQGTGASGTNGGGGILTSGGSGSAGNGAGASAGQQSGAQGGTNSPEIKYPENWKMGLPAELQESGALSAIQDIPSLAKSYVNAQKLIGADKIALPSKHATPDEWREVYHKLGLPKDAKEYKLEAVDGVSEESLPDVAAKAHELGIMPKQTQELLKWIGEKNNAAIAEMGKTQESTRAEAIAGLQKEWGAAYEEKAALAQKAISHFGDDALKDYLNKTGLTNDAQLVKLFAKVGEILKEDGVVPGSGNATGLGAMTPAAAGQEISKILGDMKHPYWISEHPGHKAAVAEMAQLYNWQEGKR